MRRLLTGIKKLLLLLIGSVVAGIVSGLFVLFAVSSLVQKPILTFCVGLLFVPFHLSDLKAFWRERKIHLIALRIAILTLIASAIFGLLRFAFGFGDPDTVSVAALLITIPLAFCIAAVFYFFHFFLPDHSIVKGLEARWERFIEGGKALGLWWNY